MSFKLFTDQARDVRALRRLFRQHRSIVYVLPTGGGKSVCSGYIAQKLRTNGFKVLILVHRKELVAQFYDTLHQLGLSLDVGVVCPGWTPTPWCPIQIGMVFSWARRKPDFTPDFIFVDEAHHIRASTWETVLGMYPDAKIMGMTATPVRLDGKGLGTHFETMHEGATPGQLVKWGRLAPVHIKRVPIGFHHTKKKLAGEFNKKEQDRLADARIVGNAASAYVKHLSGIKTVMFAVSRRHSRETAEALRALGVDAAHIGDDCTDAERTNAVRSFDKGNCMVLCNVGLIDEGFDVKACGAVMDVSHTLSTTKFMQRQGRSRRFLPGKTAVLMDLVGNVARHSHPDVSRIWSLDDNLDISAPKRSSERGVNMRMCDQCLTMFQPKMPACPHCGHIHDGRPVVEVDVELIDDYAPPPPPKPKAEPKMTQKQRRALLNDCRYLKRHDGDEAAWLKLRDAAADVGYESAWAHIMADHIGIPSNARA